MAEIQLSHSLGEERGQGGGSQKDIWSSGQTPPQERGPEGGFQVELQGPWVWQGSGLGLGIHPPPPLVPELHGDLA